MDSSGNYTWTKLFGGCSGGGRVVTDSSDNIYIGGRSRTLGTANGSNDNAIFKIADNGTLIWVKQTGTSSGDETYHIDALNDSNFYFTGFQSSNWLLGKI